MQFLLPLATKKKTKYNPRHFRVLADHFCNLDWQDSLQTIEPGNWAIVVRSPGYHGLGRTMASRYGIDCAFDLLSGEELEALRTQRGKILVDLGWEMLNPTRLVVESLAETLADLGIEPTRVFIFHSNQSAREQFVRHWTQSVGTAPPFSLEYPVAMALCVVHHQKDRDDERIRERREEALKRTLNGSRSRLFASFNGEVRPHRLYIAAALESFGLLDRSYFSLIYPRKSAKETDQEFRQRTLNSIRKLPRGLEFEEAATRILAKLPMELDLGEIPPGGIEEVAWLSQDPTYYDDSRFSVVIDTAISDSDSLFVTEKVLKPIMNHSPFLLIGSAGGANLMRSYGFKTFEPHIRQCESGSYEDVIHNAVEEIVRLSLLREADLDEFSWAMAATCDYNAAQFWYNFPDMLKHKFEECLLALGPPGPELSGSAASL